MSDRVGVGMNHHGSGPLRQEPVSWDMELAFVCFVLLANLPFFRL